jgi:hypothetical protein
LPLGDPPHAPIPMTCARCGLDAIVEIAADGQPAGFDTTFTAPRLLAWFAAARASMASGSPGVALGACRRCGSPLVISSRQPISLPCPHCRQPVVGTAVDTVVDQWPEPWCKVEGGDLSLEYRLAIIEASTGLSAGCAACGHRTPSEDPSPRCRRCNAAAWLERPGKEPGSVARVQLGARANGTRLGRPFNALVPIVQGEMMLRADAALGTSAQSGSSLLGVTGVGCAVAIALVVLVAFAITLVLHFAHC